MKRKLTDLAVARIKAPASGRLEVWDTVLPAFGFRISATGARTWIVAARRPGAKHPVRLKVGTPDEPDRMSLADARSKARQLMESGAPELPVTFKDLTGQFLEHGRTKRGRPLRPATKKEYKRSLLTYAVPLHAKPVRDIRCGEIAGLIREVASARGSTSAMRTRAALSRFWSWLIATRRAEVNPVTGTEGYSTAKRQRALSDRELRQLWAATEERSDFNMIVRLCLWLGTRRSEPGGMRWSELVDGVWTVPGERTKNHRALILPLPKQARAELERWPRFVGRKLLFGRAVQSQARNKRGSAAFRAGQMPRNGSISGWATGRRTGNLSRIGRAGICTTCAERSKPGRPGSASRRITSKSAESRGRADH